MAGKDMTPVTITLERAYGYQHAEKMVWVGPGVVSVPKWVADEWAAAQDVIPAESKAMTNLRAAILATDEAELTAIPGIGEKSAEALRAWASTPVEPPPVTVETVTEKPRKTTETVEVVKATKATRKP